MRVLVFLIAVMLGSCTYRWGYPEADAGVDAGPDAGVDGGEQ